MEKAAKQLEDSLLERERQVSVRETQIQETSFITSDNPPENNLELTLLSGSKVDLGKLRKEVDDLRAQLAQFE